MGLEEAEREFKGHFFMMILSRMSCKTSATLQLGKVFKPVAVVLKL